MFKANQPDVVQSLYATDDDLLLRQDIHDQYTVPALSLPEWALRTLPLPGDARVLDVGCGPGRWAAEIQTRFPAATYVGLDRYPGMLRNHPLRARTAVGDAAQLPFAAGSFDVVMANHMLYYLPDPEAAIRDFKRVLKPGGLFMATTNSVHNLPEIQAVMRRALTLLAPPGVNQIRVPSQASDLFSLESGTRVLSRHFYAVVRYDLPLLLVFPDVTPVLEYLESTREVRENELPVGVKWDEMMIVMREQITRMIDYYGEFPVNKLTGLLVATNEGGFISPYLDHLEAVRERLRAMSASQTLTLKKVTLDSPSEPRNRERRRRGRRSRR